MRHRCSNLVDLFWGELDKGAADVLLEVGNPSCTYGDSKIRDQYDVFRKSTQERFPYGVYE
jgi:hypothetical protein